MLFYPPENPEGVPEECRGKGTITIIVFFVIIVVVILSIVLLEHYDMVPLIKP